MGRIDSQVIGGAGAGSLVRIAARRVWCCAVVLAGTLALMSCTVLTNDQFPAFLPWVRAELDLRGALPADIRDVRTESVATPAGDRVFAVVAAPDSADPATLLLVDQDLATVVEREDPLSFDSRLFVRVDGAVQIGTVVYDPATRVVSNAPEPENAALAVVHDGTDYWQLSIESSTGVAFNRYDTGFIPVSSWSSVPAITPAESVFATWVHRRFDTGGATGELIVLLQTTEGLRRTVLQQSALAAQTGLPIDAGVAPGNQVLAVDRPDALRETPAGILVQDRETLRRFDRETGAERERFQIGVNPRTGDPYPIAFDPAGEFYIVLDTENRVLYQVDVWW